MSIFSFAFLVLKLNSFSSPGNIFGFQLNWPISEIGPNILPFSKEITVTFSYKAKTLLRPHWIYHLHLVRQTLGGLFNLVVEFELTHLKMGASGWSRGVKLIFTRGHISLMVAFKGPLELWEPRSNMTFLPIVLPDQNSLCYLGDRRYNHISINFYNTFRYRSNKKVH